MTGRRAVGDEPAVAAPDPAHEGGCGDPPGGCPIELDSSGPG